MKGMCHFAKLRQDSRAELDLLFNDDAYTSRSELMELFRARKICARLRKIVRVFVVRFLPGPWRWLLVALAVAVGGRPNVRSGHRASKDNRST